MNNPEMSTGTFAYMAQCHSNTVQTLTGAHVSADDRRHVVTTATEHADELRILIGTCDDCF